MKRPVVCLAALVLTVTGLLAAEAPKPTAAEPKALKRVDAKYPDNLKKSDIEGKTELKALVNPDGTVGKVLPVACQATKNGKLLPEAAMKDACDQFVEASRQAFTRWKYPARAKADTSPVVVTGRFKFFIDKSKLPSQ